MKKFPRAIPRNDKESRQSIFVIRRLGWKRFLLGMAIFLGLIGSVYLLVFYRITDVKVNYLGLSGKECLIETDIIDLINGGSLIDLIQTNYLQKRLNRELSCLENIRISWRGIWGVDVYVMTTEPIMAVVKLISGQEGSVEDAVFYVNKYGDIVRFQAAIGLPRVYLRTEKENSQSSEKFLETTTLSKLLQAYDFFAKEMSSAPRIEVSKAGYAWVSTAEISNLLIDLNGDLENQLGRYLYILEYLRTRNQQVKQIDVRYNWNYIVSQD